MAMAGKVGIYYLAVTLLCMYMHHVHDSEGEVPSVRACVCIINYV